MDEAFKAQTASGKAIVLLRDYTTGSTFSSGSINRTVDLADHTWTCTGKDANSAAFEINYPDVTLTVKSNKTSERGGLPASGMFIISPPFQLKELLKPAMPQLVKLLGQDGNATFSLESGG